MYQRQTKEVHKMTNTIKKYGKAGLYQRIRRLLKTYNKKGYVMIPYRIPLNQYDQHPEEF